MSAVSTQSRIVPVTRRRISRGLVLVLGVIVVPFALSAALNSYGALTVDGALRMAYATVAGQTIAILSAIAAVVLTITQRRPWPSLVFFLVVGAFITVAALSTMGSAGDLLLTRLDLIADVDRMNG
ncbi:hypothetical protein [Microbacterium sp. SLBN-146]|uniref:hypothetical protein n=1 Tax=Microbacterium sp. SLBN-146 TaxID=2768457 RepID=UPI00114EB812|nr:hypothetical protein [Microbacterium sp. SLBN-146]TQJ31029.1 hypothetical protein FBY39_1488 [Microbacterium sp. SLBN-146]